MANPLKEVQAFVKQHKMPVVIAGGAGAFLLLSHRGSGGGATSDTERTYGTIVPVMQAMSDTDAATDPGDLTEPEFPVDPVLPPEPELPPEPAIPSDPPAVSAPAPASTATSTVAPPIQSVQAGGGVTVAGVMIHGATGQQLIGSGTNAYGHYAIYLVKFPAGSARYWHYVKDEKGRPTSKVTGPHDAHGTIPGNAAVNAVLTIPAPSASPQTPAPAAPAPVVTPTPVGPPKGIPAAPSSAPAPAPTPPSLTLGGHKFNYAISYDTSGSGHNQYGSYNVWRIKFMGGRTEEWYHYLSGSAKGQVTGPH